LGDETGRAVAWQRNGIDYVSVPRQQGAWRRVLEAWCPGDAGVPAGSIARAVGLADRRGAAVALIPADRRIDLVVLAGELGRSFWIIGRSPPAAALVQRMASPDGPHVETFVDVRLLRLPQVYLETADPCRLARLDADGFRRVFYGRWCGDISRPRR
jgi:hypothetical protein